jgi:hypothetical protein
MGRDVCSHVNLPSKTQKCKATAAPREPPSAAQGPSPAARVPPTVDGQFEKEPPSTTVPEVNELDREKDAAVTLGMFMNFTTGKRRTQGSDIYPNCGLRIVVCTDTRTYAYYLIIHSTLPVEIDFDHAGYLQHLAAQVPAAAAQVRRCQQRSCPQRPSPIAQVRIC